MFDQGILDLLNKLSVAGYSVYLVGGVVRDYLLGKACHDYDACTNATPAQIKEVYKDYQIFSYGEKFGTIGINYNGNTIEITTFRSEDGYVDNRHPRVINFNETLNSDVLRRDFTINAICYDVKNKKIVDLVNGEADLKEGIIRCVGIPHQRFEEDALRIIRAIRFSARFNFKIEGETRLAILKDYKLLANVSKERITEEMAKILVGGIENVIEEYYQVFKFLIPELNGVNIGLLKLKTDELVFRLVSLLNDTTDLNKALNNFRFPKVINLRVKSIINNLDLELNNDLANTRKLMHKLGLDNYLDLNNYHKLIGLPYTNDDIISKAISLGYDNKCLAVNGRNIKAATGFSGKEISKAIEEVFSEVIDGKLDNDKDKIKEYLFNKYGKANFLKQKLDALKKIVGLVNKHNGKISVGAGAMLYFRGVDDYFGDLDLSINKDDYDKIKAELDLMITDKHSKWGYINCFSLDGVGVDLVVKEDDVLKVCDLEYNLDSYVFYLERLDYWYNRYLEFGRYRRVEQIKKYMEGGK